ncbi:MAG: hypothetical protein IJ978_02890, partial [Clostridia bacterium]|nr:hypothetical protein [Clostridia bacterium]
MDKTLKAELWDKMQYMFRNYYDRMVHCVHYYDGKLDVKTLKQVLVWTVEKVPVLHSAFHGNLVEPYWSVEDYTLSDFFIEKDTDDVEKDVDEFITGDIPVDSNVQLRVDGLRK